MPLLWGKSSSKEVKCVTIKSRLIDKIRRQFNRRIRGKKSDGSGGSRRHQRGSCSERAFNNFSLSKPPSMQVSRCTSFTEDSHAEPSQPPMLDSVVSSDTDILGNSKPSLKSPLSEHGDDHNEPVVSDDWGGFPTTLESGNSSIGTNDLHDSQLFDPQASDYDISNVTNTVNSPTRHRDDSSILSQRTLEDEVKPVNPPSDNPIPLTSAKMEPSGGQATKLQIAPHADYLGASGSHIPSPSRRPVTTSTQTPLLHLSETLSTEPSKKRPDNGKPERHKLPLPPPPPTNPPKNVDEPIILESRVPFWKKGRLIGNGTYGQVYLGFNSGIGELCAIKEVTMLSDDAKSTESAQQLKQEISILRSLQHPNIVQYFGSETVRNQLFIYLEYVAGGSIYKLLQDYGPFDESGIRLYTRQILSGLAYLHSKNTVHRDIKGANILIEPFGRVKLADFGIAKHITGQSYPFSFRGSPHWMAPEIINKKSGTNFAVDIWSLGCTIIEMATTKPPWSQYEGVAALFRIGYINELPEIPANLSDEGKNFVLSCLQRNPSDRPTAAQLLDHPFVKSSALPQKSWMNSDSLEPHYRATDDAAKNKGNGQVKKNSNLSLEGAAGQQSSDPRIPKNLSCPVSPIRSPLLESNSPQPLRRMMSPPIFSFRLAGESSNSTSGNTARFAN